MNPNAKRPVLHPMDCVADIRTEMCSSALARAHSPATQSFERDS